MQGQTRVGALLQEEEVAFTGSLSGEVNIPITPGSFRGVPASRHMLLSVPSGAKARGKAKASIIQRLWASIIHHKHTEGQTDVSV